VGVGGAIMVKFDQYSLSPAELLRALRASPLAAYLDAPLE